MDDINKNTPGDYAFSLVKGAIGAVPGVGSIAAEVLSLFVASPLEKRRQQWMKDVEVRLLTAESQNLLTFADLEGNDLFIDVVAQASTLAIKTSQLEKLEAFKNSIINTAIGIESDEIITHIFLQLLDSFTSLHIRILHFYNDPVQWYQENNKEIPQIMGGLRSILFDAYPDLKGQNQLNDLVWDDLRRAGLHNSGDLATIISPDGMVASRTTDLGKRFLSFISEYKPKE